MNVSDPLGYETSRARQVQSDYAALHALDLKGMDLASRMHVAGGSVSLAGMMGDRFHTVDHKDGIPWDQAPLPKRAHRCTVWTSEWFGLTQVARCACGAVIENIRQKWSGKNSRRGKGRMNPDTRRRLRSALASCAISFAAAFVVFFLLARLVG